MVLAAQTKNAAYVGSGLPSPICHNYSITFEIGSV